MKIHTVCLDLDDTLLPNTHKYFVPNLKCAAIVAEALGRHGIQPIKLLELRTEIDLGMVGEKGLTADRVPQSWVLTYERLCERAKRRVNSKVVRRLLSTGARYARGPFTPLRGVPKMIRRLSDRRRVCLVTAGSPGLQWRKINESGLGTLFHDVHVTLLDKKPYLASLIGEDPSNVAMVGDSLRSDILPAVELGMTAVHVPSETWAYAKAEVDATKYHRLENVNRLPEFLAELEKSA